MPCALRDAGAGDKQHPPWWYRYGAWDAPRTATAGDVVRYEYHELGNDLGSALPLLALLDTLPATALLWVTRSKRAARRYRRSDDGVGLRCYDLPHAYVLATDPDDGYLIIVDARGLGLEARPPSAETPPRAGLVR